MGGIEQSDATVRGRWGGPGRFAALVIAPIAAGFGAWCVPYVQVALRGPDWLLPILIAASGLVPLIGLFIVVIYVRRCRDWSQFGPYLPFALVAAVFAVSMLDLAMTMPRDGSADATIPFIQGISGFMQAWLALGAGLTSFFGRAPARKSD